MSHIPLLQIGLHRLFQAGVAVAILGGLILAPVLLLQVVRYFSASPSFAVFSLAGIAGWTYTVIVLLKMLLDKPASRSR